MVHWHRRLELLRHHAVDSRHTAGVRRPPRRAGRPERWTGFTAVRKFRGVTYHIDVRRAGPGNALRLSVGGRAIDGTVVPHPAGTAEVSVEVKLG